MAIEAMRVCSRSGSRTALCGERLGRVSLRFGRCCAVCVLGPRCRGSRLLAVALRSALSCRPLFSALLQRCRTAARRTQGTEERRKGRGNDRATANSTPRRQRAGGESDERRAYDAHSALKNDWSEQIAELVRS